MKTGWNTARYRVAAAIVTVGLALSVPAQTRKVTTTSLQLGDVVIVVPPPNGFEEAASQFENIRTRMSVTEDPGNDMLAVHLPAADCEKLRQGAVPGLTFYTKISVRKAIRSQNYSPVEFEAIRSDFQKQSTALLDITSPQFKSTLEHAEKAIKELGDQSKLEMSQPVNLGEFDSKPNIYSVMLLLNLTFRDGDNQRVIPLLSSISFVRVKQRLLYVYVYRRYESKADVEVLRDFSQQWTASIVAAN
jgi:hypothetical protein